MDFQHLKGYKVAIDDVCTTYSASPNSHKGAWANLIKKKLNYIGIDADVLTKHSDISDYDAWLVLLPMEFTNTWNLFGGANDEVADRIQRFLDFDGPIACVDHDMPDLGAFVRSRKTASDKFKALDADALSEKCADIPYMTSDHGSYSFVMGDSHSISVYQEGSDIKRMDGKTLYGVLKRGLESYLPYYWEDLDELTLYFGNIDVRHHLMRQDYPEVAVVEMVKDYVNQARLLKLPKVTLCSLLPVEHEGRKIPKTGWYKGSPFYGSREWRANLVELFNAELKRHTEGTSIEVHEWPQEWYEMSPEQFAKECMESPGSVHLSQRCYKGKEVKLF